MVFTFNFADLWDQAKGIIWEIVSFPFIVWNNVNPWAKLTIFIGIFCISALILYSAWKARNDWKRYYRE